MDPDCSPSRTRSSRRPSKGITRVRVLGRQRRRPARPATGNGAVLSASTPASDPNVTGVGGTTLDWRTPRRGPTTARPPGPSGVRLQPAGGRPRRRQLQRRRVQLDLQPAGLPGRRRRRPGSRRPGRRLQRRRRRRRVDPERDHQRGVRAATERPGVLHHRGDERRLAAVGRPGRDRRPDRPAAPRRPQPGALRDLAQQEALRVVDARHHARATTMSPRSVAGSTRTRGGTR